MCCLLLSETFFPVVNVGFDCICEVGVEGGVLSVLANGLNGCTFASVLSPEDNGGVLSVGALNLDVIRITFFDCCRNFYSQRTVRQHFNGCCRRCCLFRRGGNIYRPAWEFGRCPFVEGSRSARSDTARVEAAIAGCR